MKTLDRTGVISQSLRVFICGLAGLLPFIGIIPATAAVIRGIRIRRAYSETNPADHYRKWGIALGSLSLLLNLCAVGLAITNALAAASCG
jgi:hypothetical protein